MTPWSVMPRTLLSRTLWGGSRTQSRDTQQMAWCFWKKARSPWSHPWSPCVEWPVSSQVRQLPECPWASLPWKDTSERADHSPGIKRSCWEAASQSAPCTVHFPGIKQGSGEARCQQCHGVLQGNPCPGHLPGKGWDEEVFSLQGEHSFQVKIAFSSLPWPEIRFKLHSSILYSSPERSYFSEM